MTKEKIILPEGTDSFKITAAEGKTLIRTADNMDFGEVVYLGYRYRDAVGELLDAPVLELPEDYHEEYAKVESEEEK